MLLIIDNYDSFTYNLVQYLGELGADMEVHRNDRITVDEIEKKNPAALLISPGPGTPDDGGISLSSIDRFHKKIPILGVCLGHQCIGQYFGGLVRRADRIMHGKTSLIYHNNKCVFHGLDNPFEATRYHSLLVDRDRLPDSLEIIAETDQGEIMGLCHKDYPVFGVQFHPESILTVEGKRLLSNFLKVMDK
ncbi:MAG: aminodeoxychorismate/anthranilate synthase component II [Candidatus Omnitrophota bacterium]|jgi:anthranilate synthase/aminodeoxychorismate synthase-like glutamine amidotransferase|nr:MAG: aminodeoxychorismate/anthranilate synthase component II [Candidatus Omnitrophota bacterium]